MSSTRITGSALSLVLDDVDYWADVTSAQLSSVENGPPIETFHGEVHDFSRKYLLEGTAIQSLQSSSFWRFAWANSGRVIDFRYSPLGNHEPLEDSPHFIGKVRVGPYPAIGGDAGKGEYEFDFQWEVIGKPRIDDGITPGF